MRYKVWIHWHLYYLHYLVIRNCDGMQSSCLGKFWIKDFHFLCVFCSVQARTHIVVVCSVQARTRVLVVMDSEFHDTSYFLPFIFYFPFPSFSLFFPFIQIASGLFSNINVTWITLHNCRQVSKENCPPCISTSSLVDLCYPWDHHINFPRMDMVDCVSSNAWGRDSLSLRKYH